MWLQMEYLKCRLLIIYCVSIVMYDYLFSFSHFDRKQLEILKRELFTQFQYDVFFLTRKNFSQHYNSTYINLKKILFGKYLVVRGNKDMSLESIYNNLKTVISYINSNEMNLNFFCLVHNKKYYFYDFFTLSSEYNSNTLYNITKQTYQSNLLYGLQINYLLFFYFYIRIFNLNHLMHLSMSKSFYIDK